jgi:hypothetical protein
MYKFKLLSILAFAVFLSTSCSLVDKIKEKMSSNKEDGKKEQTVDGKDGKEKTVENTSGDDLNFYNKYIDVSNKISESGEGMHKEYLQNIPEAKNIKKALFIMTVTFDLKVGDMERAIKDYKRSFFDGGELSKLKANEDMKRDIESSFKSLLDAMESYYNTGKKVSDYFKDKEYEKDLSKASDLDAQFKENYSKFKDKYDAFNGALKKYKPKKKNRDVSSMSDPKEKSMAVLMNAYENTLDGAETFFGNFQKVEKNGDMSSLKKDLSDFENAFGNEKKTVESTEFTDVTKGFKYSFQDYFSKTVADFVRETNKFLDKNSGGGMKENDYNQGYDNVVTYYNYMINAYNSSIQSLNLMQSF